MAMILATVFLAIGSLGAKPKISDVYLLLPQTLNAPDARHVKYTIQAFEGCYKWVSANSKVVAVTPLTSERFTFDQDCQNPSLVREYQGLECYPGALIEPVATVDHPPITLVTAIDQTNRGESLKCEVKVGRISRLEILTTVKSFRVLDHQKLYAQAFDEDGNVFSGLEGLRFRWHISSGSESLSMPKLKDSLTTLSEIRREIENSNSQSDMVLVEGKATGVANVTLKFQEPGYEGVPLTWTLISISEPFALLPSPEAYLPICSKFQFRVFKILEHKVHREVSLPSSDYVWSASSEFLEIKPDGVLRSLGKEGNWNVVVKDSKIESNIVQCQVNVVKPDKLVLFVTPFVDRKERKASYSFDEFHEFVNPSDQKKSNWYLIAGQRYSLKVVLFWRDKVLEIPKNAVFSISFVDSKLWKVVWKSDSGDEMVVEPELPLEFKNNNYPTKVDAKLEYFEGFSNSVCKLETNLVDTEEANIIRQIKINEESRPILLPYFAVLTQFPDKEGHQSQEYRLRVEGGSFSLKWQSSDPSVATVSASGTVFGHRLGKTQISVTDTNNELNQDSIEVEVSQVEKLIWSEDRLEIVKGSLESVEIKALASQNRIFHNCTSIFLELSQRKDQTIKIRNKNFVSNDKRKLGICEIRNLEALEEGQALISVHLIHSPGEVSVRTPDIRLSSEEGRLGIFLPLSLRAMHEKYEIVGNNKTFTSINDANALVLSPGASAVLELIGGPWPWDDLLSTHKEKLLQGEGVKIVEKKLAKDKRLVEVQCPWSLKPRDIDVKISVMNEVSEKLLRPGSSHLDFTVACHPPDRLKLSWVRQSEDLKSVQWKSIPAYYDKFRRRISHKFLDNYWVVLNEQELMVSVNLIDSKGREFLNFSTVALDWLSDKPELISYNKVQPGPVHVKSVLLSVNEGPASLEARISKMIDGTVLSPSISSSLDNEVVKNVDLSLKEYSMYLHRQNSIEILILHGSGHFEVSCNSTDIVQFTYDGDRKIIVFPKKSGKVSLKVDDVGLAGSAPATSQLLISQLASLELREGGLIPVNSTVKLYLSALDSEGKTFAPSELKWMNFELSMHNAFQVISYSSTYEEWEIKGGQIGEFQVQAVGLRNFMKDEEQIVIKSNFIMIDVFPPLEIVPNEVLLLPGSKYSLNYRGGPEPNKYGVYNIHLQWTVEDESIASVDSLAGLVNALKVGEVRVTLKMIRKQNTLTQAFGKVRVRLATSVGILGMGPGRMVLVDSATRLIAQVYYYGEEFTDATMAALFTWKSNSPAVYSIFQENEDTSKQIAVTGLALAGGKSDITLHVDIQYPEEYRSQEHTFTSKVTATVDSSLISQSPSHRCHSYITFNCDSEFPRWLDSLIFLLPPNSAYKLPVNKDSKATYKCLECREDFLKVSDSGLLTAGSVRGESSVVIQNNRVKGDVHLASVIVADIESIHIDKSYTSRTIALGSELEFDIIYQDSAARSYPRGFDYGIDVGVEVSNSKVLTASLENRNSTLRIYSQYAGDTIIKVFLNKNAKVKDVLKVSVTSVMKPVSPVHLHLGGEVQFETTHSTPAGVVGLWSTENPTVLTVSDKGLARSLQEGDTYVHYREKSMDLRSLVSVQRVRSVELGPSAPSVITNYERHPNFRESFKVPLRLFADSDKTREIYKLSSEQKKNIKQNIHVKCSSSSHSDFVFVESEIDKADKDRSTDEPGFGCVVTPNVNPSTTSQAGKELVINVLVGSKGKSLYSFETSVKVPFVSKFTIPSQDKQIVLYGRTSSHSVLVAGSCGSLQVNTDSTYVHAKKIESPDRCMIEINVLNTEGEIKLKKVEIIDSITGQKEELLVSYYNDPAKADISSPMSVNDLIIFVALVVLLYLVYNFFKNNQQQPVQPAYRNFNYQPPRYPPQPSAPRMQTPGQAGPAGPASTPGSSAFKNIGYRANF